MARSTKKNTKSNVKANWHNYNMQRKQDAQKRKDLARLERERLAQMWRYRRTVHLLRELLSLGKFPRPVTLYCSCGFFVLFSTALAQGGRGIRASFGAVYLPPFTVYCFLHTAYWELWSDKSLCTRYSMLCEACTNDTSEVLRMHRKQLPSSVSIELHDGSAISVCWTRDVGQVEAAKREPKVKSEHP